MRFAKTRNTTRLKCCACTQNDDGHLQNAAPATETATHLAKKMQKYCACHTKRFSTRYKTRLTVTKCHPCHAKRSNMTFETWDLQKWPLLAELTIGTAIRPSHGRLRTVANGCERLQTVANGCGRLRAVRQRRATHPQPPDPRVKREPLLRIREKRPQNGSPNLHHAYTRCSRQCNMMMMMMRRRRRKIIMIIWKLASFRWWFL